MQYDAFISYRHGADARLALALQAALGRLARPWFKRRALRVFRDDTDLAASPSLWSSIQQALEQSGHFILLASPEAAQSTWVQRELDHWLRSGKGQRLLLVLCEGEIAWNDAADDFDWSRTTALPTVLRGAFAEEPLWVDLRWTAAPGADLTLRNQEFKNAAATIAAPLHGRTKDQLVGADLAQHRRTRMVAVATTITLLLLIGLTWFFWLGKNRERSAKESEALRKAVAQLAAESLDTKDGDLALLLAVEAARLQRESGLPQRLEVEQALRQALGERPEPLASLQHEAPVRALAFAPDGQRLATADGAGQVRIWQTDGREMVRLEHGRPVTAVAWSGNGKWLASADEGGTASVWLAATGSERMRFEAADGERIWDVELNYTGELLAIGSSDQTARVFNVASRQEIARLEHPILVTQVDFLPSRRGGEPDEWLMTKAGFRLHFWNWRQGREQFNMAPDKSTVSQVTAEIDPSGSLLALATQVSASQQTVVLDIERGTELVRVKNDSRPSAQKVQWQKASPLSAESLSWGPRGKFLASAGRVDGSAVVTDLSLTRSGRDPTIVRVRPIDAVKGVALLDQGLLATRSSAAIRLWDITTGVQRAEIQVGSEVRQILPAPSGDLLAVVAGGNVSLWGAEGYESHFAVIDEAPWQDLWSSDGRYLLGQDGLSHIALREAADGRLAARLPVRGELYQATGSTTFSPEGQWLAAAVEDRVVIFDMQLGRLASRLEVEGQPTSSSWSGADRLAVATDSGLTQWDVAKAAQIFSVDLPEAPQALAASPDGQRLAAVWPSRAQVFDSSDGSPLGTMELSGQATDLAWSPSGDQLAIGDGTVICLWNGGGTACQERLGVTSAARVLAYSPDGEYLFVGGKLGDLLQWRLDGAMEVGRAQLVGAVQALDFSADGTYLATAAGGRLEGRGLAQVWRVEGLEKVAQIEHLRGVTAVGFSPDDRWLATRTAEPKLRVWAWRPANLAEEACQRLKRNLSAEEWQAYFGPSPARVGATYRETCPGLDAELANRTAADNTTAALKGRPAAGPAIRAALFEETGRRMGQPEPRQEPPPPLPIDDEPVEELPPIDHEATIAPAPAPPVEVPVSEPAAQEAVDLVRLSGELKRLSNRILDEYEDFLDREDHDTDDDEEDIEDLLDELADAADDLASVARRARGDGGGLGAALRGKKRAQKRAEDNLRKQGREVLLYGGRLRPLIDRYPVGPAAESTWQRIDRLLRQLEASN